MNPFEFDWEKPVPDTERDQLLKTLASNIRRRGLDTPAIWFLEIHKPLAPLGGQFAVLLSPFLGLFFAGGAFDLQRYTAVLRIVKNIDLLISMIDSPIPTDSNLTTTEGAAT